RILDDQLDRFIVMEFDSPQRYDELQWSEHGVEFSVPARQIARGPKNQRTLPTRGVGEGGIKEEALILTLLQPRVRALDCTTDLHLELNLPGRCQRAAQLVVQHLHISEVDRQGGPWAFTLRPHEQRGCRRPDLDSTRKSD